LLLRPVLIEKVRVAQARFKLAMEIHGGGSLG
jgi:hypothetical protein